MTIKRHFRNLPLKVKLRLITIVTCLAALVVTCGALFWFQSVAFRESFAAELESLGAIIARNCAAPLTFRDAKSAEEVLAALKVKPEITGAFLFDEKQQVFAFFLIGDPDASPAAGMEDGIAAFRDGDALLRVPVIEGGARLGVLHVRARFADKYRAMLWLDALVLAVVLALSLVVILVVSGRLQRIITRPIDALAVATRVVAEKRDYAVRVAPRSEDELGQLTMAFNQMLAQIQAQDTQLRESRARFEIAVAGSSDGIWDFDLATGAVYLSPRWKNILGYEDHELSNDPATFPRLVHPDDLLRVLAAADAYVAGAAPTYAAEFRMRHKDGSERWVLSRGAALRDEQGKAVRFAGSHTDITERRRNEEQIRLAREKFESLVNSVNGIVWEANPRTSQCLFISNQTERILGYPVSLWLKEPDFWARMVHPDDRAMTLRASRRGLALGQPFQFEHRVLAADGRTVWLRESVSVERKADGWSHYRGLAIDVTEQKLAADQIARMQRELVDASRMAGMAEIATGVLHNVGNVLNSVNLSAGLVFDQLRKSKTANLVRAVGLLRGGAGNLGDFLTHDPKGRQLPAYFEAVSAELAREQEVLAREAQSLLQNVEHIKQIVATQQSFAKVSGAHETVAVSEVLEHAVAMSTGAFLRHRIELVREFAAVPSVLVDRHMVLQILVNLVTNAKQALDSRAEGRRIVLRIVPGGVDHVRVEVADNGMGIAPENLTRIFNHGFTTKRTGHGFGLHSSANAAKEMGGSLSVVSDGPGTGATFVLELPRGQPAVKAAQRRAA